MNKDQGLIKEIVSTTIGHKRILTSPGNRSKYDNLLYHNTQEHYSHF
ncbi:MAG: hypothetical protein ABI237_10300 [Ginsengibacter sp.]